MKIFGMVIVWQHSDRGNISAPGADMNELCAIKEVGIDGI